MINVSVNEEEIRSLYLAKLDEKIGQVDVELVFWDRKELERRTCMCWSTIQKEFFFEPGFPKHKVGSKWYFPAAEAQAFLISWLRTKSF
ncbi:group-specific protein [Alkalihalobacillus sp. FSL R5-0424]